MWYVWKNIGGCRVLCSGVKAVATFTWMLPEVATHWGSWWNLLRKELKVLMHRIPVQYAEYFLELNAPWGESFNIEDSPRGYELLITCIFNCSLTIYPIHVHHTLKSPPTWHYTAKDWWKIRKKYQSDDRSKWSGMDKTGMSVLASAFTFFFDLVNLKNIK